VYIEQGISKVEIDGICYSTRVAEWDFVNGTVLIKLEGVQPALDQLSDYPVGWRYSHDEFIVHGCMVSLSSGAAGWGYSVSSPDSSHGMTSGMCLPKAEVIAFVDEIAKAWGKLYPKQGE